MRANNVKDAEEFFQRALKLDPDEPSSLLQLGQIRYRQGNIDDARKLVSRYNKLVSPNPESLWLALRIERKLGTRRRAKLRQPAAQALPRLARVPVAAAG